MIQQTIESVQEGTELVSGTFEDFKQVVSSTKKAKELIDDIDSSSGEQSIGIDQINEATAKVMQVAMEAVTAADAQ